MDAQPLTVALLVEREQDSQVSCLWARFTQTRDPEARLQLIECYMPLARSAAARLFGSRVDDSIPFGDYLQYARLGLVEAVDRYDPQREASFETFSSYRIRGAVLNGLGKESEFAAQRSFWRTRTQDRLESLQPTTFRSGAEELEDFVQLTVGLALGLLLDDSAERIVDESVGANPYAATELSEVRRVVHEALGNLPERERDLITRHYFGQCEFQAIAQDLGITKGRVSQLHAQALARIRGMLGSTADVDFSL